MGNVSLNIIQSSRQLLRAFGGLNESYACSEAEFGSVINFSSRGYPALVTRKKRQKKREIENVNGMYHLNGTLICRGKGLEYTPDSTEERTGAVVLEDVLTDDRKALVGMGSKILIFPDKAAFDTATGELTALGAVWEQSAENGVTIYPCDAQGKIYQPTGCGENEPDSPKDGQLFLKCDPEKPYAYTSVLEKYHAKTGTWVEVILNHLCISAKGLGDVFAEGDTITISGVPETVVQQSAADLNGDASILSMNGDSIIIEKTPAQDAEKYYGLWNIYQNKILWRGLDFQKSEETAVDSAVKMERRVPDLDFVVENSNRVWGCNRTENTIYACKLGDPTNWYSYQGIASDSYAVSVGSDGAFTGAESCMGYVLFFKENCIHKLYGSKPSDYQITSVRCRGLVPGASHSLCVIAETLYYLSADGVMAWDGSLPVKVSAALDTVGLTDAEWVAAGSLDTRYYLYLRQEGAAAGRLLVYDTERGVWHEESAAGDEMLSTGRQLYLWDGSALWAADPDREADSETDEQLQFEAVSGDIGLSVADDKYISRITLRIDALERSVVTLAASYDGGAWETVSTAAAKTSHDRLNMPFVPRRHDTLRLRITGKGQIAVRSMAMTLAASEGNRVSNK